MDFLFLLILIPFSLAHLIVRIQYNNIYNTEYMLTTIYVICGDCGQQ